jgi:hypothetical protein
MKGGKYREKMHFVFYANKADLSGTQLLKYPGTLLLIANSY